MAADGAALGVAWGLPFAGMLLSIALLPLLAPGFWHRWHGTVAMFWALAFVLPFAAVFGIGTAVAGVVHTLVAEYLPFIVVLTALFTTAGGIHLRSGLRGTPARNAGVLALGAVLASVMGTTGASVLLIRPLLHANRHRRQVVHLVVFFIFIVGNAGGALTPLGDPPLLIGFLHGVDFGWTLRHLWPQTLFVVGALLAIFWCVDSRYARREPASHGAAPEAAEVGFRIDGAVNLIPLLLVTALVLLSGFWKPAIEVDLWGTRIGLERLVRDAGLIAVTLLSLAITPRGVRAANGFGWAPLREVALLFIGIFVTVAPVLLMLEAGAAGVFSGLLRAVVDDSGQPLPRVFFWLTGGLSALLDNAPTYLVFFELAGGDAQRLMTTLAPTLAAISAGSVFMGALTYIGNAPNLMIKAMAEERGVAMPGFFGYMAWSGAVLLPLLALVGVIWFG